MADTQRGIILATLVTAFSIYSAHLYTSLPVKSYPVNKDASAGKQVWQQYNCTACHQVYGLGGYLGPDLTNVYSFRGPDYIKMLMKSGTDIMPNLHLSEDEINNLLAYLKNIDSSGSADARTFKLKKDGTIEQ